MKIKELYPKGRRLLVEQQSAEKVTKGGIVLADAVVDREQQGEYRGKVLAIGDLAWRDLAKNAGVEYEPWCKVGDTVLFHRYAHTKLNPDKDDLRIIINDTDVLAVIETEDN